MILPLLAAVLTLQAVAAQDVLVTCGSLIKLEHGNTKFLLHSHEINYQYGSGSGQQSVTAYPDGDDFNSYWAVKGTQDVPCIPGTPIKGGDYLRLQHRVTSRWLHSHLFQSPLSRQQEVSCFGDDNSSDTGDVWQLEVEGGKGKPWVKDARMRLKHKDTGTYLITHKQVFGRPIQGQQEVCATKGKSPEGWWRATEGVYFPQREEGDEL